MVERIHNALPRSLMWFWKIIKIIQKKLFKSCLTCEKMREFNRQYHGLFKCFFGSFETSHITPFHVWSLYDNGTYKKLCHL